MLKTGPILAEFRHNLTKDFYDKNGTMVKRANLGLMVVAVLVFLIGAGSALADVWTGKNGNARQDGHVPIYLAPEGFSFAWEWVSPNGKSMYPLTAGDNKVFVSVSKYLYCIDATDGNTIWTQTGATFREPAYANGSVFIPTGVHSSSCGVTCSEKTYMRRYDAEDGNMIFRSSFGSQWSKGWGPTPYADKIYYNGGYYGGLYEYEQQTGDKRFKNMPQYLSWSPSVEENYVYCFVAGKLYVIDRTTLSTISTISDPMYSSGYSMNTIPVLGSAGNVFVSYKGRLINFDTVTNSVRWLISGGFSGLPVYADGLVYVIRSGKLLALNESNGQELWSWQPQADAIKGNLVLTNSHIFVRTNTEVFAVELISHEADWFYPAVGYLAIANNQLYIANSANGTITALYLAKPGGNLESLEIRGPDDVQENSSQRYRAIAYYDNGNVKDVTELAQWMIQPETAGNIENGSLETADLTLGTDATIVVEYSENQVMRLAEKTVYIYVLSALEITGPNEVPEDSTAWYQATAYYDNGMSKDVTNTAEWFVEPNVVCDINAGILATEHLNRLDEGITIYANYDENSNYVDAAKEAQIFSVCSEGAACTLEGLVERELSRIMARKQGIMQELEEIMAQEQTVFEMLDTYFKDRDFRTAKKNDIVKSKQAIHSAIQHEKQAETAVEQSLDKLYDALDALDIELNTQ